MNDIAYFHDYINCEEPEPENSNNIEDSFILNFSKNNNIFSEGEDVFDEMYQKKVNTNHEQSSYIFSTQCTFNQNGQTQINLLQDIPEKQNKFFQIQKVSKRKFHIDGIHKKIKVKYQKFLVNELNRRLRKTRMRRKFGKFSQMINFNISIKFNKELMKKPLKELLLSDPGNRKEKAVNNRYIALILLNDPNNPLKDLWNLTYGEIFDRYYLSSSFYESTLSKIMQEESYDYWVKYKTASKNFTSYYWTKRVNEKKRTGIIGDT